jgi:hypothetical protein
MILIVKEWEILIVVRSHCKVSFECNPFKFGTVHLLPVKALWNNLVLVNIKKTTAKITSRMSATVKSISKLKCNFYINHYGRITDISKIRTRFFNKSIIWAVILVIIKPLLNIWISEHS